MGLRPAGFLGDAADIHLAPMRQKQGAGNRCRGHHQQVGGFPFGAELQPLVDAKTMLLIDHSQRQIVKRDLLLKQRMRADNDRQAPIRQRTQNPASGFAFDVSGQQRDGHRREFLQRRIMLLGQYLRRRQQGSLSAGLDRAQQGQHRHQRLARPHIALQQPQHPVRRRQISIDLRQCPSLRLRRRKPKPQQSLRPQHACTCQSAPGALAPARPNNGKGELPR